eukprot:scaffold194744_cov30-Tisochrysis_lutea.AAC.7
MGWRATTWRRREAPARNQERGLGIGAVSTNDGHSSYKGAPEDARRGVIVGVRFGRAMCTS